MMRVPTLVMESNAVPGFTNRVLARFVSAAAVSFEAAAPHFRGKATVTGNPIRREFFDIREKERGGGGDADTPARFSLRPALLAGSGKQSTGSASGCPSKEGCGALWIICLIPDGCQ